MKQIISYLSVLLCIVACNVNASGEGDKLTVLSRATAQKVITTDSNALSIGILIPDRGMADPHVWKVGDRLFVMCGHDESWDDKNTWVMDRWELWSTTDLINWEHHLNILPTETYIGDKSNCWAGDICERNGKYYWLFSNRNINTGIMVADEITGPYKDLLGRPLIEEGLTETPSYDPEIYIENGEYTVIFGAGKYYMATLSDDMRSLKTEPKKILVLKDGVEQGTDDKSTLFKRGDWYYLAYGNHYAISKNLYGPYEFAGDFTPGGHNSVFEWDGIWYVIQENFDTNIFYRGIGLQPIFFNEDGTIRLASKMSVHPGDSREYRFSASQMGWHSESGTTLEWDKSGVISGKISSEDSEIGSAIFLMDDLTKNKTISLDLVNESDATTMEVSIASHEDVPMYWDVYPVTVNWADHSSVKVPIKSNSKKTQHIKIELSKYEKLEKNLMKIKIKPACEALNGNWTIDNIIIK